MYIFIVSLCLKEPLVGTLKETCALTSTKCIVVEGMNVTKSSKKLNLLWLHSSIFAFCLKMLIFEVFPPARESLVATFSETCAITLPKDIVNKV